MTTYKNIFLVKNLIQATSSRNEGMKLTKFHNNNAEIEEFSLLENLSPHGNFYMLIFNDIAKLVIHMLSSQESIRVLYFCF